MPDLSEISFTGEESELVLREFMQANGFLHIKDAFDKHDLKLLSKEFFEKHPNVEKFIDHPPAKIIPGAAHVVNRFERFVSNPKILNVVRKLIDGQVAYTSHSDLHSGLSAGWHKDDGNGKYFEGLPDYFQSENCCVYKVGVYLQDCPTEGGLTVKPGTHKIPDMLAGNELYLPSRLGDAIIFDVRITHKGWAAEQTLFDKIMKKISITLGRKQMGEKIPFEKRSVFFTFGAVNEYTSTFSKKNMERQISQIGLDISMMPTKLRTSLELENIYQYF